MDKTLTKLSVLFSIIMAAATIQTVGPTMLAISRAATAATELFSLIDRESEINPLDGRGDYPDANHTSGIIDLENVAFSYPTRPDIPILQDFSLHIPAGKVTAIVVSLFNCSSLLHSSYNMLTFK